MSSVAVRSDVPAWGDGLLDVMVEGPEGRRLADTDLRRLFPGSALTGARLNRLTNWPRLVVRLDDPAVVCGVGDLGGITVPASRAHPAARRGVDAGTARLHHDQRRLRRRVDGEVTDVTAR